MERGRQYRVVTQALAGFAGLLALVGAAATVFAGSAAAGFPLALGTLVLVGAVYASSSAVTHYDVGTETPEQAGRRRRISVGVTTVLGILLALTLLVEVLALLAGLGYFQFFGDLPLLVLRFYGIPVAVLQGAFAGAVALRTWIPGEGTADARARGLGYAALAAAAVAVVAALSINGGVARTLGLVDAPPNRAPFVLALAFFPLFRGLRTFSRYPPPRAAVAWFGDAVRAEERDLGPGLVVGASGVALAALGVAAFLQYGYGDTAAALGLSAAAVVSILVVPVGVGFARIVEEIEQTREDYKARRSRRRQVLLTFTGLLTLLAAGAVAAAVAAPFLGYTPILLAHFPVLFAALALGAAAGAVARTQVETEDEYTLWRKVLSSQLVPAVVVLAFLGVFLAAELARGPIVGPAHGVLVLTAAWGLALLHVKNRLLLPSIVERGVTAYRERREQKRSSMDPDERVQRSMVAALLATGGITMAGIAAIVLMVAGVIPQPSTKGTQIGLGGIWLVLVMVASGVTVFRHLQRRNIETVQTSSDSQEVIGERRFKRHELLRYSVLGFSVAGAVALFVLGGLVMAGVVTSLAGRPIAQRFSTDFFVFGLLMGLGPYGYFHAREQKRIRKMDERLPEFLRDLAESKRAGMTLTEAIITASQGTYGELTPEIRKMAAQLEWGVSFTEALTRFGNRVDTPLVERTVNLIVEASNAGGNVVDVLTAAADDAREIQQILQERRDSMVVYVMIIYVAFLVFLGVIGVLNAQFIPEISKAVGAASEQGAPSIGGLSFSQVDTQAFRTLFFHAAVIQGLGGGLVAGVMRGGKPVEGLKHSFAMIALAYVTFRFLIGA